MSWQARLAGALSRRLVRPALAREGDPLRARRSFERAARRVFRDPPFTLYQRDRLRHEHREIPALWARDARAGDGVLLWFHGGAYIMGSPRTHRAMVARLARAADVSALLPDYRLAPEHLFPAAFDDCLDTYLALLARGYPASRIVLGGDSAGGGLALAVLAEVQRHGLPEPAGVVALSPLVDMSFSGASISENAARDPLLPIERAADVLGFYMGGGDPCDTRASPLFAEWLRPPPTLLLVSETEVLRDDAVRMAVGLRSAGGEAECEVWPDLPHVWPILQGWLPEADAALERMAGFLRTRIA